MVKIHQALLAQLSPAPRTAPEDAVAKRVEISQPLKSHCIQPTILYLKWSNIGLSYKNGFSGTKAGSVGYILTFGLSMYRLETI